MKKNLVILVLILFSCAFAAAQNKLLGEWKTQITNNYAMTMVLMANSKCTFDGMPCTYSYTANTVTLKDGSGGNTSYQYTISGNQLTLSSEGAQMVFLKQGKSTVTNGTKTNTNNSNINKNNINNKTSSNKNMNNNQLIGKWSGNGETIEFRDNGTTNFAGNELTYKVQNDVLSITTAKGLVDFHYKVSNGQLTMTLNDKKYSYFKSNGTSTFPSSATILPELVNKWCFVKTSNSNGVQKIVSSSSECVTLYANGTYEYFYEGGMNSQNSNMNLSTASQDYDKGTWRATKEMIFFQSQKNGFQSYTLQKVNNSNHDPMIVIGERSFVSFYNKPAWK